MGNNRVSVSTPISHDNLIANQTTFLVGSIKARRGRDRMVVGFTTTYAISAYQH